MNGLFDGTPLERPVTCAICDEPIEACRCPRGADGKAVRPQDQAVRLRIEKRRRGKTVTVVSDLDLADAELSALMRRLKTACAAGGTVTGGQIEIQGEHAERVSALLQELGYPPPRTAGR